MKRFLLAALTLLYIAISFSGISRPEQAVVLQTSEAWSVTTIELPLPEPPRPPAPVLAADPYDAALIARTIYGEARGCSVMEQAAVAWCILNRVDATGYGMGQSVAHVITFPGQFAGYSESYPVLPELLAVAEDVLIRWAQEKQGELDVGRVLPKEYLWFSGDGHQNYFRNAYNGGTVWDWPDALSR